MPSKSFRWTNESVRRFARNESPIDRMERIARASVLEAAESGWLGPPYDPIELATSRGIRVQPNASIADARVFVSNDQYILEYNPNRTRGRVNFSIAHEIAHTFFEDCREKVRDRVSNPTRTDDWQLEMLCNIGAAEILMPVGALPSDIDATTSIEDLMALRKQFQVSSEALLIRLVKLSSSRIACFAASPTARTTSPNYRMDYCIASQSWADIGRVLHRQSFSSDILNECVAIGTTAKGDETWLAGCPTLHVEAMALPPYPKTKSLRVVGVIRPASDVPQVRKVEYRLGDAADFTSNYATAILHLVNDKAKSWGGKGFAQSLKAKHPTAFSDYHEWTTLYHDRHKLGGVHVAALADNKYVVSIVAQAGYGPARKARIRYGALDIGLTEASERLRKLGVVCVQMPRIGSGQAGGHWDLIAGLIHERLVLTGLDVRVIDLS